eukprot:2461088-Pleurochrysis_carterae.AAC.2
MRVSGSELRNLNQAQTSYEVTRRFNSRLRQMGARCKSRRVAAARIWGGFGLRFWWRGLKCAGGVLTATIGSRSSMPRATPR